MTYAAIYKLFTSRCITDINVILEMFRQSITLAIRKKNKMSEMRCRVLKHKKYSDIDIICASSVQIRKKRTIVYTEDYARIHRYLRKILAYGIQYHHINESMISNLITAIQ